MQQYSTSTKQHLVNGLFQDGASPDTPVLIKCVGAMPTPAGLMRPHLLSPIVGDEGERYSTQFVDLFDSVDVFTLDENRVICIRECEQNEIGDFEVSATNKMEFVNRIDASLVLFPIARNYFDSCKAPDAAFFTDGMRCGYFNNQATALFWWDSVQGSVPTACTTFMNRFIFGGIVGTIPAACEKFYSLLIKYAGVQSLLPTADILARSIIIGLPNGGSYDAPLELEASLLNGVGSTDDDVILEDRIRTGEIQLVFFEGTGVVKKILPLGDRLVVYGEDAIYQYTLTGGIVPVYQDGIDRTQEVDGDLFVHGGFLKNGDVFKYSSNGFEVRSVTNGVDSSYVEPEVVETDLQCVEEAEFTVYTTVSETTEVTLPTTYRTYNGYTISLSIPVEVGEFSITDGVTTFTSSVGFAPGVKLPVFAQIQAIWNKLYIRGGFTAYCEDITDPIPQFTAENKLWVTCPIGTQVTVAAYNFILSIPLDNNTELLQLSSDNIANLQYSLPIAGEYLKFKVTSEEDRVEGAIDFVKKEVVSDDSSVEVIGSIPYPRTEDGICTILLEDYTFSRYDDNNHTYDYNFTSRTTSGSLSQKRAMIDRKHHILYLTTQRETFIWGSGISKRHEYIWGISNYRHNNDSIICLSSGGGSGLFYLGIYPADYNRKTRKTIQQIEIRGTALSNVKTSVGSGTATTKYEYKRVDDSMVVYPMITTVEPAIYLMGSFDGKASVLSDVVIKWQARDLTYDRGLIAQNGGGDVAQ